jgi:hypothetical protein
MASWLTRLLTATGLWLAASAGPAVAADPIVIVSDRVYREGVFLVVDATVANRTGAPIDGVEASVVFLDFFDTLVRAEHTVVRPVTLGAGQVGILRVFVPFSDAVRKVEYRFTWRQNGSLLQSSLRRDIWTLGSATR